MRLIDVTGLFVSRTLLFTPLLLAMSGATAMAAPSVMIEIADTGAYRLSHAELSAAMPDLGEVDSDRLRLSVAGETLPLHVDDGGDGRFGPGDYIRFYGERLHGPESWFDTYAVNNVYRLEIADSTVTTADPAVVANASAATIRRQVHLEQENLQIRLNNRDVEAGSEPDLWFWSKVTQIDPKPFATTFSLPDLAAGTVELTLGFRGMSRAPRRHGQPEPTIADHEVEIRINGDLVKTTHFANRDVHQVQVQLPRGSLAATDNTLELTVPRRFLPEQTDPMVDVVMFDFLRLDYAIAGELDERPLPLTVTRAGDMELGAPAGARSVTLYGRNGRIHEGQPVDGRWRFTAVGTGDFQPVVDGMYLAPAAVRASKGSIWSNVETGYDYLLISHASLRDAATPLADFHRGNGLRVAEVDVADLYDEFNHGVVHPRAIRDFVAHAYHQWPQPRPRFVLLVGDASFDVRSDRVEDNRYAKWVNRELLIPDHFGEIPGQMYADTDKLAANRNLIPTWQYPSEEGHSAADNYFVAVDGDDWLPDLAIGRFPVVEPDEVTAIVDKTIGYATNTDFGDWRRRALFTTDTSAHFQRSSDQFGEQLTAEGFQFTGVYAKQEETDNLPQINALNDAINEGQLLVHFIGHGGRYIWRTGPPDPTRNHDLFTLDHVANLDNAGRLPMVLSMTCYSAPFDHPSADSIGERFLREPDKGAIAVFAASWRNTPSTQFSQATIDELMTPGASIGEALMRAKQVLTRPHQRTLVETYNLLGDPAVVLQRPSLPVQLVTQSLGTRELVEVLSPDVDVNGRAVVEWLDAEGALLARSEREVRGQRSRYVVPEQAADAATINVHLVDYGSRRDGIARLSLSIDEPEETDAKVEGSPPQTAPVARRTAPRPYVADRIFSNSAIAEPAPQPALASAD